MAGVAAALDNTIQIVGVAPDVSLWTSKDGNATPNPAFTACGIQFGRTNNVDVINISSSFPPYTAVTDQIKVVVTDALGVTGNHEITVHENSSAPICFI